MLLPDTRADAAAPAAADFDYVIHARRSFLDLSLRELGRSGELLYFLVWRDLKVRYKQALIGAGWAVVKPLLMMLIFVAVFGVFMRVPTGDTPYAVMVYTGLLPWTMVATVISAASASLISNAALLTRIYFPRLLAPLSSSLVALVDRLRDRGYVLLDTQWTTPHLRQFGARDIPRREYMARLRGALARPAGFF